MTLDAMEPDHGHTPVGTWLWAKICRLIGLPVCTLSSMP